MSFSVRQMDHVEIFVSDIARAREWYERALGLKETARWDPEPVMIGAGGTKLALFRCEKKHDAKAVRAGWHRVAWLTDQKGFAAAQEHLRSLGIPFRGPIDHGMAQSVYFSDPDENLLEITFYL
jgi:catechol 2,3-dioxygenase-like lactoylglutathione lyase family enzyme